jgi:hypothetical protein
LFCFQDYGANELIKDRLLLAAFISVDTWRVGLVNYQYRINPGSWEQLLRWEQLLGIFFSEARQRSVCSPQ